MPVKKSVKIILIMIIGCMTVSAALYSIGVPAVKKKTVSVVKKEALGWREEFAAVSEVDGNILPAGWKLQKKPGTKPAVFSVETDAEKDLSFLHMGADKASACLINTVDGVDLKKTPFLRWRWRVTTLPQGADGRMKAKDDQAIGIYVGTGSALSNKSVSYRWDTETPRGEEGNCAYGLGGTRVKWYTLRNREDAGSGQWFIEERNVAEDFKRAWGFYPEKIYLSVSCNSQYTGSKAAADLEWIEFVSPSTE